MKERETVQASKGESARVCKRGRARKRVSRHVCFVCERERPRERENVQATEREKERERERARESVNDQPSHVETTQKKSPSEVGFLRSNSGRDSGVATSPKI